MGEGRRKNPSPGAKPSAVFLLGNSPGLEVEHGAPAAKELNYAEASAQKGGLGDVCLCWVGTLGCLTPQPRGQNTQLLLEKSDPTTGNAGSRL